MNEFIPFKRSYRSKPGAHTNETNESEIAKIAAYPIVEVGPHFGYP
jgi:hypothetical protein